MPYSKSRGTGRDAELGFANRHTEETAQIVRRDFVTEAARMGRSMQNMYSRMRRRVGREREEGCMVCVEGRRGAEEGRGRKGREGGDAEM